MTKHRTQTPSIGREIKPIATITPTALSGGAGSSASLAQSPRLAHSPTPTPAATVPSSTQPGL